ncbi:MAG: hypothetical protein ACTSQE_12605 [Candidatus Heimdallarchaeaceae archaeon]
MEKNTLTLTFEEIQNPETKEKFIAVAGTIIKRILDKDGNTIPTVNEENGEEGVEHIRIDFMQSANDMAKNLSKMAVEITKHGIKNYEKQQKEIEAKENDTYLKKDDTGIKGEKTKA